MMRRRMAVMTRTIPSSSVMQGSNSSNIQVGAVGQQVVPGAVSPVGGINSGNILLDEKSAAFANDPVIA